MPRRSTRARVTMAVLALPLLVGCNCCDALAFPEDPRPAFTAEQVVGVWNNSCGGTVSIAEGGTFQAEGLVVHSETAERYRGPVSGTGTWKIYGQDAQIDPSVRLTLEGQPDVLLFAQRDDKFSHLETEVGPPNEVVRCRLSR